MVSDNITPALESLAEECPKAYIRAIKSLGGYFRNQLMRGFEKGQIGQYTFRPLSPITHKLREVRRSSQRRIRANMKKAAAAGGVSFADLRRSKQWKNTNRRMSQLRKGSFGGRVPSLSRYVVSDDPSQIIRFGFLGDEVPGIDRFVIKYQRESGPRAFSTAERRMLHMIYDFPSRSGVAIKRKRKMPPLPSEQYDKPEREAVAPILPEVTAKADEVLAKTITELEEYYTRRGWPGGSRRIQYGNQ